MRERRVGRHVGAQSGGVEVYSDDISYSYRPPERAACEPRARTTCDLEPKGMLRELSSAFGVCSACASRNSAVLASPPGSPRAAQGDELRLPRASAAATRNPQGSRGPYVLLCDARKQSAAAWVDRQAALGAQDAGPNRVSWCKLVQVLGTRAIPVTLQVRQKLRHASAVLLQAGRPHQLCDDGDALARLVMNHLSQNESIKPE